MIFYEKWGLVLFIIAEVKTKGKAKMKPKFSQCTLRVWVDLF